MGRRFLSIVLVILLFVSIIVWIIVINSGATVSEMNEADVDTLRFVQIIFRHGERTNVKLAMCPNDPNINFTYPPYGYAELTNNGKKQAYNIGKYLQQRYDKFLGDSYLPNLIKATTSNIARSQMSLQLVLAGLSPPKNQYIWETELNWQPIAYKTIPLETNRMLMSYFCPGFIRAYYEFMNSTIMQQYYQNNKEFYDYVSVHCGWNITTPAKISWIYDSLQIEEIFGLDLPEWAQKIYPHPLEKYAIATLKIYCSTDKMKRLYVGYLLKQLRNEIFDKISGKMNEKLSLYSGHDYNIAGINAILGLFDFQLIPFGAYLLIELHEIENNYVLKFYFQDNKQPEPRIIIHMGCEEFITVDTYSKMIEKYLPEDDECEAGKNGIQFYFDF